MVGLGEEYDSAVALMIDEYELLRKLNPNHPLLPLLTDVSSQGFRTTPEFNKKYQEKEDKHCMFALTRGYFDFKNVATFELVSRISRLKKDLGEKLNEEALWRKLREEGLEGAARTHITHNQRPLV